MSSEVVPAAAGGSAARAAAPAGSRSGRDLGALLLAEWTKIRSVRSTAWALIAMAIVAVGLTALATAMYTSQWSSMKPSQRLQMISDPIGLIFSPAASYGQVAACVLGVLVIATEYSTGMIRASMLAVPRRTPMLAAKAVVLAAVVFAAAEVVAVPSFLLGQRIIHSRIDISLTGPGVLRSILGFGLYLAVIAVFALAVGMLIRHIAGAITAVVVLVVVVPTVTSLLPGKLGQYLSTYLPGGSAGQSVMSSGHDPSVLLSPWRGFAVMCAWTAALLVLAALRLRRRDLTESG